MPRWHKTRVNNPQNDAFTRAKSVFAIWYNRITVRKRSAANLENRRKMTVSDEEFHGSHEPYTRQGLLESGGCFFVCGTGRQPIQRDKTINDNYYLLTLAALAQEIRSRGAPTECTIRIAAGLPLTSYGRDILMTDVEEKYFLSPTQQEMLLHKSDEGPRVSESIPPMV